MSVLLKNNVRSKQKKIQKFKFHLVELKNLLLADNIYEAPNGILTSTPFGIALEFIFILKDLLLNIFFPFIGTFIALIDLTTLFVFITECIVYKHHNNATKSFKRISILKNLRNYF